GLTPFEALQTATTIAAEALGAAGDLGSIEPGKLADLVFVEGNPLADIKNARKVRRVMKNGELYGMDVLLKGTSIGHGPHTADISITVHEESEIGSHHFFPTLKSLIDPSVRIGVVFIVERVVVAKFEPHTAALRHLQRHSVRKLP